MPLELIRNNVEQFRNIYSRTAEVREALIKSEEEFTFRNVVATENPVIVFDWYNWKPIREMLLMSGCQIPESRQIVLLNNHTRFSTSSIKGKTRDLKVEGTELIGSTFISETAPDERKLVEEQCLTDTSIGYKTYDEYTVRLAKGESTIVNGRTIVNNYEDGMELVVRTKWMPFENSLTPIGADAAAKFRSMSVDEGDTLTPEKIIDLAKRNNINIKLIKPQEDKVDEETRKQIEADKQRAIDEGIRAEIDRQKAIRTIADDEFVRNNLGKDVDITKEMASFLEDKSRSAQDFQSHIFKLMKSSSGTRTSANHLGMSENDLKDYSMRKVILAQVTGDRSILGVELEAHNELVKRNNLSPKGILIPEEIQKRRTHLRSHQINMLNSELRSFVVGTPSAGGYTVQNEYLPMSFQELLQQNLPFLKAGVEFVTGVTGNIPITRELTEMAFYWAGEGEGPTESAVTFGQEVLSPKKGGVKTKYSYEFLMQTALAVEVYIEKKMALAAAAGLNNAIAYADGLNNKIKGLKYITGVGGIDCTTGGFTRARALEMSASILDSGAMGLGEPKWISKGALREQLKNVEVFAGTGKTLVDDNNKMIGYDYSNVAGNVAATDLFLGIWPLLMMFYWNQLEVLANPYGTGYAAGDTEVRALLGVDLWCERPQAFEIASNITIG